MPNWYLAAGERTRRIHLVEEGNDGYPLAICHGMIAETRVAINPEIPMIDQVTCANCNRIGRQTLARWHRQSA
jgi:hypothetical protein